MHRRLLVAYQNMVNAAYRMQRIINIEDRAARDSRILALRPDR
jgi:hypothetical protein